MRRKIPLDTYSHRRSNRYRARRSTRVSTGAVIGVLVLLALAAGAWALGTRALKSGSKPAPAKTQAVAVATVTPAAVETAEPEPAVEATEPAPSGPPTISIAAVGDMLFDREVENLIESEGGEAPLADVADQLSRADVAVGNLETTLARSGERITTKEAKYCFRGHPAGIKGLKLAGFDAVSIANNHMLDYGPEPLLDTISSLEDAGIAHSGSGKDRDAAWEPATVETENGAKVAYLAYTHIVPAGFIATDEKPGVASGKRDMDLVEEAVRKAKETHDYVIVSFHWGVEYQDNANSEQERNAKRVIDAGADMVLAHHPHVIQGVEFYNNKLIAYSLGDFVFDHYSRKTGESFILDAQLGPKGVTDVEATPVYLDGHGKPEYVHGDHAEEILTRLKKISKPYGTTVEIDGDTARLSQ